MASANLPIHCPSLNTHKQVLQRGEIFKKKKKLLTIFLCRFYFYEILFYTTKGRQLRGGQRENMSKSILDPP